MMTIHGYKPSQIRKALVATLGAVVMILTQVLASAVDVLPASWAAWITAAVGVCTAAGVFLVRNAKAIDGLDDQ